MEKRLVSENVIQCNNQSSPEFASYGPLVAYRTSLGIKIQCIGKEIKELEIKNDKEVKKVFFKCCTLTDLLYLVIENVEESLMIYQIEIIGIELKTTLYKTIVGKNSAELKDAVGYFENNVLKILDLYSADIKNICSCTPNTVILEHEGQDIMLHSPLEEETETKIFRIFHRKPTGDFEESPLNIDYISNPVAIYKNRFVFHNGKQNKEIEIYNVNESKKIGKFEYEGEILKIVIKGSILLVITTKENMDRYCFYMLNDDDKNKSLLSHRCVYEKGKGSYFSVFNCIESVASSIVQAKAGQISIKSILNDEKEQNQILIIYVLPLKKSKIEITLVSSSTIKEQTFREKETDTIIVNKTQIKNKGVNQAKMKNKTDDLEIEGARIKASIEHRKNNSSVEDIQKKMIDHIVGIKINGILEKFEDIENRLTKMEHKIQHIYEKIEKSIENINREEVKKNVENLFDRVTPQFESYFKEVFRQITGVLDKGVEYYESKLNKESELHREAFNQIVHMTFDATQEIIQLGREELGFSEKISNSLEKIVKVREKWAQDIQSVTEQLKYTKTVPQSTTTQSIDLSSNDLSPDKRSTDRRRN